MTVSWSLGVILAGAASYGLLAGDPYRGIEPELAVASRGQDVLTLAAVPVLIWAGTAVVRDRCAGTCCGSACSVRGARRLGRPATGWLRPRLWER